MSDDVMGMDLSVTLPSPVLRKLTKQFQSAASGATKEINDLAGMDLSKVLQSNSANMQKAITRAWDAGLRKTDFDGLRKVVGEANKQIEISTKEAGKLAEKLADESLSKSQKKVLKNQLQKHALEVQNQRSLIIERSKATEQQASDMEDSMKALKGVLGENAVDFTGKVGTGLNSAVDTMFSTLKSGDIAGLLGATGKGLGGMEKTLEAYSKVLKAKGNDKAGQGAENLGKVVGKLGKSVAIFAAVAAGFAAIVKVLIDADSQAKEFNRNIIDSAGALSLVSDTGEDLRNAMDGIRNAAFDPGFFLEFGVSAKDALDTLNALNEAGVTFREMTADVQDLTQATQDYQANLETVVTYSRLLGVSTSEMASQFGQMQDVLGSSNEIFAQDMSAISDAAMESGFSVSRFNGLVMQATSGMALYNARTTDAANLLVDLTRILGQDVGAQFFSSIAERLQGESIQDSMRRTMIAGSGEMTDIIALDVERQATDLARRFGDSLGGMTDEGATGIFGAYQSITGQALEGANSAEQMQSLITEMANMGGEQFSRLISSIGDIDEGAARGLTSARNLAQGLSGELGDVAMAVDDMSIGAALATELQTVQNLPGMGDFAANIDAFAGMVGEGLRYDRQQINQLQRVFTDLNGSFLRLQDVAADAAAGVELTDDQLALLAEHGIDPNNDIAAQLGENLNEFIIGQGASIEEMMSDQQANVDEDIALARQVAANTLDVSQILEFGVQYMLEQLLGVTEGIRSMMGRMLNSSLFGGRGGDAIDEDARRSAISELTETMEEQADAIREAQNSRADLASQLDQTSDLDERDRLTTLIENLDESITQQGAALENTRDSISNARSATTAGELNALTGSATQDSDHWLGEGVDNLREALNPDQDQAYLAEAADIRASIATVVERIQGLEGEGFSGLEDLHRLSHEQRSAVLSGTGLNYAEGDTGRGMLRNSGQAFLTTSEGNRVAQGSTFGGVNFATNARAEGAGVLQNSVRDAAMSRVLAGGDVGSMSLEQLEAMEDMTEALGVALPDHFQEQLDILRRAEEEAIGQQTDALVDATEEGAETTADLMLSGWADAQEKLLAMQIASSTGERWEDVLEGLRDGDYDGTSISGTFSDDALMAAAARGIDIQSGVNDFIYRRDGSVIPIASDDEFVGMQPGGPVDRAGGGSGGSVSINIYGGDENRVYDIVRRAVGRGGRVNSNA